MAPPALDHAIRRSLAKDPDDRWQTARDLELELKWIAETGPPSVVVTPAISRRKLFERLGWAPWVVAVAMALLVLLMYLQHRGPINPATLRFLVYPPANSSINAEADAALSPDGSHLAFVAADLTGKEILWIRSFDSLSARPLAGTEGAAYPFWSPDGRWVGFFANRSHLMKIDISGGPPVTVASATAGNGGTWNRKDVIVFATGATRLLYRVSAARGQVVPITKESETVSAARRGAQFMPDGSHYLYDAPYSGTGRAVYVASLDSDSGKLLVESGESPTYQNGRLLYLRGSTL